MNNESKLKKINLPIRNNNIQTTNNIKLFLTCINQCACLYTVNFGKSILSIITYNRVYN